MAKRYQVLAESWGADPTYKRNTLVTVPRDDDFEYDIDLAVANGWIEYFDGTDDDPAPVPVGNDWGTDPDGNLVSSAADAKIIWKAGTDHEIGRISSYLVDDQPFLSIRLQHWFDDHWGDIEPFSASSDGNAYLGCYTLGRTSLQSFAGMDFYSGLDLRWTMDNVGNMLQMSASYEELRELSNDPAAPSANRVRFYCKDNGAGKTGLYARFNTGAVQQVALQP